jgi:hypothetical protein
MQFFNAKRFTDSLTLALYVLADFMIIPELLKIDRKRVRPTVLSTLQDSNYGDIVESG